MMAAAFWDFLGWEQLTAAEQVAALAGACLGLAAWLLTRAVFGGRRRR
jgi:prepilin signal peptidase PulO-like enzyme (type II secretory pathway)